MNRAQLHTSGRAAVEFTQLPAAPWPGPSGSRAAALLRSTRPRQWTKNLLVLAAPTAAGMMAQPATAVRSAVAVLVFVAASSSTYLVNDIVDRKSDLLHPVKKHRPVAAGEVPVALATSDRDRAGRHRLDRGRPGCRARSRRRRRRVLGLEHQLLARAQTATGDRARLRGRRVRPPGGRGRRRGARDALAVVPHGDLVRLAPSGRREAQRGAGRHEGATWAAPCDADGLSGRSS